MDKLIWRNRLVLLVDGCFHLSARGQHDNFDFAPAGRPSDDHAVAGNVGVGKIWAIEKVDEDRLRFRCSDGNNYILTGDDFHHGAIITEEVLK